MADWHKEKIRAALIARPKPPTKRCSGCHQMKAREQFGLRKNGYLRATCLQCNELGMKNWAEESRERQRATNRRTTLRRWFGITEDDYDRILAEQGGGCAICGDTKPDKRRRRLYVDHCHETKMIRGLLCGKCNSGIGMFRDDPGLLMAAIAHLAKSEGPDALYAEPYDFSRH